MFCPQCGISQSEDLKFCKTCGANLSAVRQVVTSREIVDRFDWGKTWVADMLLSQDERRKRNQERESSLFTESKRHNEIKAGVITSCAGVGVMIFLYFLMQGIILSGQNSPGDAEILSRLWVAGVIPFFIGLALIFNGVVVSRRLLEIAKREQQGKETPEMVESTGRNKQEPALSSADWYENASPKPSVTENTTRELRDSGQRDVVSYEPSRSERH